MNDFLAGMRAASARRVMEARAAVPDSSLHEQALATPTPPSLTLHPDGFDLIAEYKRRSPAAGTLQNGGLPSMTVAAKVGLYAEGGAAAVSVLTEPERFDGSLADLSAAAEALRPLGVPVMRKDFIVDAWQILEARVYGAGGVLLMCALLDDVQVDSLIDAALALGLFVLLEAFDAGELERAARLANAHRAAGVLLVGLNARNLRNLEVDTQRLIRLAHHIPADAVGVAESGIRDADDAACMAAAGYRLALVGSALMRSGEPDSLVRSMLQQGRGSARERMHTKIAAS